MEAPTGDIIRVAKEVEGDYEGTTDFLFFKIGAPVHLKPSGSAFDLNNAPQRPIAVSERFGLLFLAHSEGFLVAKTKYVIGLAKEVKGMVDAEKENGVKVKARRPSIQESCILDVRIGNVSILALGKDSLTLAATVGGEIRVYSVSSLAKKDQNPLLSYSLGESGKDVRDFHWRKNSNKAFTLLSMDVYTATFDLYSGNIDGHVHKVMVNIDTFDWSPDGKFLAVAWKHNLSILSGEFEKLHCLPLSFQAAIELDYQVKVDCIQWIHSDTIVIGCTQLNTDGNEDGYLVQVVNNRGGEFKASSEPTLVSFSDIFHDICDDLLHSGGGPHLLASYLDRWGIALVANRKNRNDHVVLLQLPPQGGKEETVVLEFDQEKFTPRIELQENGDDNLILGLDVDKTSLYEKLEYIDGDDVKELSPYCILLCLSSEGKVVMFHITRISDPYISLLPSIEISDGIITAEEQSSLVCNLDQICGSSEDSGKEVKSYGDLVTEKPDQLVTPQLRISESGAESLLQISPSQTKNFQKLITPQLSHNHIIDKVAVNTVKPSNQTFGYNDTITSSSLSIKPTGSLDNRKPSTDFFIKQKEAASSSLHGDSYGSISTGKFFVSGKTSANVPSFVSSALTTNSQGQSGIQTPHSSRQSSVANFSPGSKIFSSKESDVFVKSKQPVIVPHANTSTFTVRKDSVQSESFGIGRQTMADNCQRSKGSEMSDSGRELSGHFYSVNDMVKELDRLLLTIEQEGGFADASTACLNKSVFGLEKGLENLLEKSRVCKDVIAELVGKVQHLQDKMVQILAWEGYMEGVVKQASNAEYWDIWNHQKLGPDFELKQQQILKGDQNLRNHILELERHFNVIELNKFGENGANRGGRALHASESSRQIQMLHRLHTTVKSQLAAAEHLSECLSGQMAALKITSPSVKRHSMAKELLDSIGVEHHNDSFESPNVQKNENFPESSKKFPLSSLPNTDRGYATRNMSVTLKSFEPETARRRRDSLNSTWNSFEPQKTTVKRMSNRKQFRVSDINSYHTSKDSQTASASSQQNLAFSSFQSTRNESQDYAYSTIRDRKEKSYQMHEPQASSVFKWARDLSESPEVVVDSSFLEYPASTVVHTSFLHPSSSETMSLPTTVEKFQNITFGDSYLSQTSRFEEVSAGVPAFSLGKLALDPKITYTSQTKLSTMSGFPSTASNIISQTKNPPLQNIQVYGQTRKPVNMQGEDNITSSATVSVKQGKDQLSTSVDVSTNDLQANTLKSTHCTFESPIFSQVSTSASTVSLVHPSTLSVSPILSPPPPTAESSSLLSSKTAEPSPLLESTEAESSPIPSPPSLFVSSTPVPSLAFGESLSVCKAQNTVVTPVTSAVSSSQTVLFSSPSLLPQKSEDLPSSLLTFGNATSSAKEGLSSSLPSQSQPSSGTTSLSVFPPTSGSLFEASSTISHGMSNVSKENDEILVFADTQEDEMDEEAPETPAILSMGNHSLFGLGSSNTSSTPKPNPFGGSFVSPVATSSSSPFSFTVPTGEIFKPASFSFPPVQPAQSSPAMSVSGGSGGLSGFGQPAQVGSGQHALGSVLGSFGQSRQLGGAQESRQLGFAPASSSGGFASTSSGGGFAGAASGGGFAGAASGRGFASAATGGGFGGGFAGAATEGGFGGGFAGAATGGGFGGGASVSGFSALSSGGGGFGAGGGFGSSSGGFGSNSGSGKPPANLLMQMRK